MLIRIVSKTCTLALVRNFSTSTPSNAKVCLLGASGGIGQPLSMLLKQSPLIQELSLHDIQDTLGVAADVSHIDSDSKVKGFVGAEQLNDALKNADVVMISAGVPRKPGMSRDDLFNTNANIAKDLAKAIGEACPKALVGIITNPVNTCVPIAAETLNNAGKFDPKRLFGITTLDIVRSNAFVSEAAGGSANEFEVPVIGGHAGKTIIPLISRTKPSVSLPEDKIKQLTKRIQEAGTEVVKAKAGKGSATLSMAHAAARFTFSLLKGLKGEGNVVECAYVKSDVTEAKYFSTPLVLGKNGVEKNMGLGKLSPFEESQVKEAVEELKKNIAKGEKFVN